MIIGIDLGTTNSLVAYFSDEGAKIIPNRFGSNLTPSVVSIDEDNNIYVGEVAKERLQLYPDFSAAVFKRDMGTNKKFKLGAQEFTAEELSSFVLKALKEDAQTFLGIEVTEAVISVPAHFNEMRRKATKRAGELAGLKVERIISEPTAAAIAYQLHERKDGVKSLIFDLGGGTFDISVLEFHDNILEVRAVAGDNYLGGEDFSDVLYKMFLHKHNLNEKEIEYKTTLYIREQVEKAKIKFSTNKEVTLSCNVDGKVLSSVISMDEFNLKCNDLFDKIRKPIKRSLSDAKINLKDIDSVILIGGATKLPIVYKFASKLFRCIPYTHINPDEAVAIGAAIQAAMKERHDDVREIILTDVCPFTLGTEVVRYTDKDSYEGGYFCPIIERNTVIPTSRTERIYTVYDDQTQIRINILQGESRLAKNNISIGEMLVEVPKAKAGNEPIDITYTYDINSLLEVEVRIVSTKQVTRQIIKNQDIEMDDEAISKRLEQLAYLKTPPREHELNKLLLTRAERLYEESIGDIRKHLEIELLKFDTALNSQDNTKIEKGRKRLEEVLARLEDI
ncbi:MAG: molecular chaperone HscC [Epulopiscium sp. Nele67-Bin001]|nr:MAG: molecular chaperone HscC [Epulopiscium sp. Nele67-Bin001]